ncbi:MAG: hypothetical protein LBU42_00110 [Prevotellaceae bacterium]|jgi:predicted transcriptional regulator|nr:hypothetical protein [Prevotellaceae bacterium]
MEITRDAFVQTINDYAAIMDAVPDIIKKSGYRVDYIAKKLQIPKSTFYAKRKKKAFAIDDMLKIAQLVKNEMELSPEENTRYLKKVKLSLDEPGFVTKEQLNKLR